MLSAELVVSTHDGPSATLLHSGLEGGQVKFVEGTVAGLHVDMSAPQLLVVQGIVLHADGHAVLLHFLDVGHAHHAGQVGVFAHVLEVAAVQRGTVDVDTGTEQHVLLAVDGFLADGLAILGGHLGIPRGGQAGQGGESRDTIVGLVRIPPVVPIDFGTHAVGAVAPPQLGNAEAGHAGTGKLAVSMAKGHFLLQRHAAQGILHTLFDGFRIIQINRRLSRQAACGQQRGAGNGGKEFVSHIDFMLRLICSSNQLISSVQAQVRVSAGAGTGKHGRRYG